MRVLWKILLSNGMTSSHPTTVWSLSKDVMVVVPGIVLGALDFDFSWAGSTPAIRRNPTKARIQNLSMTPFSPPAFPNPEADLTSEAQFIPGRPGGRLVGR